MGTTLFLEYESLLARDELFKTCQLDREEREALLNAFLSGYCSAWGSNVSREE